MRQLCFKGCNKLFPKETKMNGLQKIPDTLRCLRGMLHDRYMAAIKVQSIFSLIIPGNSSQVKA